MRVCILTHNLKPDNGTGVFSSRILEGLEREAGIYVVALTTEKSGLLNERPILHYQISKFLRAVCEVRQVIKGCDILHAMDAYPYGIIAALASLGLKKKIVLTAIGTGSVNFLYNTHWLFTPLTRWSYRRATATTAISRFTKKLILDRIPDIRIEVIHPGVAYAEFAPLKEPGSEADVTVRDSVGKAHTVQALRPYLLSVGSIRWRKGYKRSLKAFAAVRKQFPKLTYVIVGKRYSERYYQELRGIIRDEGLEDVVVMLDQVNDHATLRALYRNAELFCLLSQNFSYDVEGFGIVFLEAAAAGLPVIGATESGIEDALLEGKNGFLVDWEDTKGDLARTIIAILSNDRLRDRMRSASLTWAQECSLDKKIEEYRALYRKVLSEGRKTN